jgi:hypothetical protein
LAFQDPQPAVRNLSHPSAVLGGERRYVAVLPPSYDSSQKRYPVLYWLYGYEQSNDERTRQMAAYAAAHDFVIVSAGPVDTVGEFPLYFPELVEHVDKSLRTIADRGHRAVAGAAMGGFMAVWTAGKYPDLVASAAALSAFAESPVGPKGFPSDVDINDRFNHDDVRVLQSDSVTDLLAFVAAGFPKGATVAPSSPGPGPRSPAPKTAPATRKAAAPAPAKTPAKPPVFRHADPYPNFTVWGWEVASNRRQPGFTILENVGPKGFRSSVREWVPGGATLPEVKLSISSPRLYPPNSPQTVTYLRLRDRNLKRVAQKADAQGRLTFDLDGDGYEVGVTPDALLTATGYDYSGASWATAGQPVHLNVWFCNKGAARSGTTLLRWESPTPGVQFSEGAGRIFGLAPGESAPVPVTFTVAAPTTVRLVAAEGFDRIPIDVVVHPPASPAPNFQIADGVTVSAWTHGTQQAELSFGEGNGDNHASPGESFAVLFPEGESLRVSELFTADSCVDNTVRAADPVDEHASIRYSLPSIRSTCDPGHVVRMLARVVAPGKPAQYWTVEFPVWYRP